MASEEGVSDYEKRQEIQADFERKLLDRYKGIQLGNRNVVIEKMGKNPTVLLFILDSAKFACKGGFCGWLPINTKLKTKPSTTRLDPKPGKLPSVSLSL